MDILIILGFLVLVMIMNINCMIIGLKVGLALSKGESYSLPNPIKEYAVRQTEKQAQKEAEEEKSKIDTILHNIDIYDGTGNGQEEVR